MIEILVALLFGLIVGSFLNVCIYRLPRDLSLIKPARSFCPQCEKQIASYDNIPVLSYLLLGGKCRHCQARIPWRYPLVEALTAALFVLAVVQHGATLPAAKQAVFHAILIVLFFSDLEQMILPDEFTLGGTVVGLAFAWVVPAAWGLADMLRLFAGLSLTPVWRSMLNASSAAGLFGGIFYVLSEAYYRIRGVDGLGLGDVKMLMMLGAFMGVYHTGATLFFASIVGAVVGTVVLLVQRSDFRTTPIPFGCFLSASALGVSLFGPQLPI